ncbi:hypothetical protein ACI77O_13180 [Pseudomonas tritici]|uniref:hypothetical protein n=1 Tax=Pseudomonas tritici TaxID=2745518 RepID=UPI00387ABB68
MDIIELTVPTVVKHNAQIAREAEVVREVDRILRLFEFPSARLWVDVRFDYGMSDHSSSKVSYMRINDELQGTVEIRFQGLFIWQDFPTFFSEVIPHEMAHILLEVRCAERGIPMEKGHADDWVELVLDINEDAEPSAKVKGEFDDRPIKLQKGGISCECDCGELDGFVVVANTAATIMKLKAETLTCSECHSSYRRIAKDKWPEQITTALNFYESVMAMKIHNAQLSR